MAATLPLDPPISPISPLPDPTWPAIAAAVRDWAQAEGIALRDAVVLLPFAQLLAPARRAFARAAGWMPRIETTQTLARSLAPAPAAPPHEISFDPVLDRLQAERLLASQPAGAGWARRDPAAFRRAAVAVADTAQALARAAAAVLPDGRDAFWQRGRDLLAPASGPGATERWLARVALEWAAVTSVYVNDRLHALRPSAWIVVQAGGADPFTRPLLEGAAAITPCRVIDTDVAVDAALGGAGGSPALVVCDGFEAEAQAAAAQVLAHVRAGQTPLALIAQDRELVRRMRALLERARVVLLDETGWKLSTTRAAAQVRRMLDAAAHDAGTDDLIDWLKGVPGLAFSVDALEAACRRHAITRVAALASAELDSAAAKAWQRAASVLEPLLAARRLAPADWLERLAAALRESAAWQPLQADAAGRQVLQALWLDTPVPPALHGPHAAVMTLADFSAWVGDVLEQRSFVPELAPGAVPEVVVTPLARAMLRPFAAVVCPGADDRHLGAAPAPFALLGDSQARALGLPDSAARRDAEGLAFAQLLRAPLLTFSRRRSDGPLPLAASPLIERLGLALQRRGLAFAPWADPRGEREVVLTPVARSAPAAAALLPQRLSASGCEALRACPYRFFALNLLRLREDDELDGEIEKREYGNWLHEVLREFHAQRERPGVPVDEIAALAEIGETVRIRHGLDAAEFVPYAASFGSFVPRYVAWLHRRDAAGARWQGGEERTSVRPEQLDGLELYGVIDRIDAAKISGRAGLELIDYKTGSVQALKDKVREPLEDTQLAFYAALVAPEGGTPMRATYLALDGTHKLESIEHPHVERSAQALLEGLSHDLRRLRGGAGLPALGEGVACTYCAARGVCRRDHWSVARK